MRSRLHLPQPEDLDAAQRSIHDAILASRGSIDGPFLAWLLSPGLAEPAQRLGAFCRYGTSLALVESELLILVVAAHLQCVGEQQIHEPIAIGAGLPEEAVLALREGRTPSLAGDRLRLLETLAQDLMRTHRIPQGSYQRGVETFGERGMVEIAGIMGYYSMVAMTLNAFEMQKNAQPAAV